MKNKLIATLLFGSVIAMPLHAATERNYLSDVYGALVKDGFGNCVLVVNGKKGPLEACGDIVKMPDADNDGVADDKDKCSGTAAGVSVDAKGCEVDSDGDRVADSKDKCPGTDAGVMVDSKGCALDSDKDGVADSSDQCPGTKAGVKVDTKGCAINMDIDGDGIMNSQDKCPNTAKGTVVDRTGCELKADIKLDQVQFKSGTAELSGESKAILDNIAKILKDNQHLVFEVAGHTDNRGDHNFNVSLSEKRAQSVRQYLIDDGVSADRLTAKGYGPDKPVASNDTREGRSQNRRVELVLQ
jgi:OmpA-OmpF porin, OOP family